MFSRALSAADLQSLEVMNSPLVGPVPGARRDGLVMDVFLWCRRCRWWPQLGVVGAVV